MIRSNRIKLLLIFIAQLFNKRYYSIRVDPIFACNLRCRMCYFSQSRKSDSKRFTVEDIDILAKNTFRNALQVVVGCGAEPTMYKEFIRIVRRAKEFGVPSVSVVTNGQLLTYEHLESLVDIGLDELILSIHGTKMETYERFMVGAQWEKLIDVLEKFNEIKALKPQNKTSLRINFTANPENYGELQQFFDVFGGYNVETLQVRPVMAIGGEYEQGFNNDNIGEYQKVIIELKTLCSKHHVQLLANIDNPTYTGTGKPNPIVQETYKYISPTFVIDEGFDWQNETYRQYQGRVMWKSKIFRKVFSSFKQNNSGDLAEKYSGRYDVF
ncbi:MAG: radical SAM protein [Bacteroidales bacterium]